MITCWGDSLTAFGGMAQRLAELSGAPVHNAGVGGENSLLIAARCNAMPLQLHALDVRDGAVGVRITTSHHSGLELHPLLQGSGVADQPEPHGVAGDVPGRLRWRHRDTSVHELIAGPDDHYEFVPDDPDQAEQWPHPRDFRYDFAEAHRDDDAVLWLGQNGPDDDTTAAMIEAFAQWTRGQWVVMSPIVASQGWSALERRLQDRWGRRYLNVRHYLVSRALTDLGLTPTKDDLFDLACGGVPGSLRVDGTHHTQDAQRAIAEHLVWPRLQEFIR